MTGEFSHKNNNTNNSSNKIFEGRLVSIERAKKSRDTLRILALPSYWNPPPLQLVDFHNVTYSVRNAKPLTCPQFFAILNDVYVVSGNGAVLDFKNKEIINDSIYRYYQNINKHWYYKYGFISNKLEETGCVIKSNGLIIENAISLFSWENRNYAHWLMEKLPIFYWILQFHFPEDVVILIEDDIPLSIKESLFLLWPKNKIFFFQRGDTINVKNLYYFSDSCEIWEPKLGYQFSGNDFRVFPEAYCWMAKKIRNQLNTENNSRYFFDSLYLHRNISANGRVVVNQDELEKRLGALNVQIIKPGELSFYDQVAIFSNAKCVISPSGAALANIFWSSTDAVYIVLAQDSEYFFYWFFHSLASSLGVKILYYPCRVIPNRKLEIFHWDIHVSIDDLCEFFIEKTGS